MAHGAIKTAAKTWGCAALLVIVFLFDQPIQAWVHTWRNFPTDLFVASVNPVGNGVTLLLICLLLCFASRWAGAPRLREAAGLGAVAFIAAGLLEFTIKHLVGRPRPGLAPFAILPVGPSFSSEFDSFPSGHATSAFAVATAFVRLYPRLRWPLYAFATCVALGRVYLDHHYCSDILAGVMIGVTVATALIRYKEALPSWIKGHPAPLRYTA